MATQGHRRALAPQGQRHLQQLGVFMQQAQVELDQVPADDGVRVMLGDPLVEAGEQRSAVGTVVQVEIEAGGGAVGRAKHVHLPLAAAFQGNAVQLTPLAGLDVQRHQAQRRAIARKRLDLGIAEHTMGIGLAGELHRGCDEALHQVTLGRADIAFEHLDTGRAQALLQLHQLPVLAAVQAQHRALVEVLELQRSQFHTGFVGQQYPGVRLLRLGNECHRHLRCQAQLLWPPVGGQPELHAGAFGSVMPMPGQDKALLQLHRVDL